MSKKFNRVIAAIIALGFVGATFSPLSADAMTDWSRKVAKAVAKNQKYPRAALAREIEGRAQVRLTVSADGSITNHEIVQETGESVLDNEIPKLIEKLNPLPALPAGKTELSFVVPLNWSLQ